MRKQLFLLFFILVNMLYQLPVAAQMMVEKEKAVLAINWQNHLKQYDLIWKNLHPDTHAGQQMHGKVNLPGGPVLGGIGVMLAVILDIADSLPLHDADLIRAVFQLYAVAVLQPGGVAPALGVVLGPVLEENSLRIAEQLFVGSEMVQSGVIFVIAHVGQFMKDQTVQLAVFHPLNVRTLEYEIKRLVHGLRILHAGSHVLPVLAGGGLVQSLDILVAETVVLLTFVHIICQDELQIHIS